LKSKAQILVELVENPKTRKMFEKVDSKYGRVINGERKMTI